MRRLCLLIFALRRFFNEPINSICIPADRLHAGNGAHLCLPATRYGDQPIASITIPCGMEAPGSSVFAATCSRSRGRRILFVPQSRTKGVPSPHDDEVGKEKARGAADRVVTACTNPSPQLSRRSSLAGTRTGQLPKSFILPVAVWLSHRKRGHTAHSKGFASACAGPFVAKRMECGICRRFDLDCVSGPGKREWRRWKIVGPWRTLMVSRAIGLAASP